MSNPNTGKPVSPNDKPSSAAQAKPSTSAPTNGPAAAAAQAKPSMSAPIDGPAAASGSASVVDGSTEGDDEREKIQYHVVVGKVETFPDIAKAEAFLNSPEAPQCTVIYGKTSLINEWHITTGTIRTFPSLVKAQKFLKETAGSEKFVMIRGRITVPEVRVSLRR